MSRQENLARVCARIAVLGDAAILPVIGARETNAVIDAGFARPERIMPDGSAWGRIRLTYDGKYALRRYVSRLAGRRTPMQQLGLFDRSAEPLAEVRR